MRERNPRRPTILRSIRTRLAISFFGITLLAVAVLYVVVAAPLTSALHTQRLKDLERQVTPPSKSFYALPKVKDPACPPTTKKQPPCSTVKDAINDAAAAYAATGSDVYVFDVDINTRGTTTPETHEPLATSPGAPSSYAVRYFAGTVGDGAASGTLPAPQSQIINDGPHGLTGVVGFVVSQTSTLARVVVFSAPLNDLVPAVSLVRSQILLAAAIALAVALLVGALVARALTVRVLRLERTAQRVAQGDFEAHFSDSSGDELGQLAAALAHMQRQLEGLEDARRRFIATASHELRTPIFSLGGFLELIQDEDLDEETRQQFVGQLREQVERLGKLATQLLDLSRLESGSVEIAPVSTDLGVLARAVSDEFVPALAGHDSQLELRLPIEPVRAVCDPERVAQLLRILIDNALVHTASGTPVVVTVTPPANGDGARLSVHDEGPGIPGEARERIFEPFYGTDGTRGAGLGLAIAHELSVQMGVELEVASAPGDTTFTVALAADGA